jgi:hypothetical protein
LLILLMLQLFVGNLPFVRFVADDTTTDGSSYGMMAGIMASDRAGSAAAHAPDSAGLRARTHHSNQSCGDHEFLHNDFLLRS